MQESSPHNPFTESFQQQTQTPTTAFKWIFLIFGVVTVVCCGGLLVGLMVIGVVSPETSVYKGNQVPPRFLETAREVGALDPGESVDYFYSDGLLDVREGFYLVNDKKVVIYSNDGGDPALVVLPFEQIESAELTRNESFVEDSYIFIETTDGEYHVFPVSSEQKGDVLFHRAIEKQLSSNSSAAVE